MFEKFNLRKTKKNFLIILNSIGFMFSIIVLSSLIVGCYDKIELENRAFVVSFGIDKYEKEKEEKNENDRYSVFVSIPNMPVLAGKGGGEKGEFIKSATSETVYAALRKIDTSSSQKLTYGQSKVVVLGKELLEDEKLFKETMDSLERNNEISRRIIVLATSEKAEDIINAEIEGEPLVGMFIANFYRNSDNKFGVVFKRDLESAISQLCITNDTIIPKIIKKDDSLELSGAAVMKNFKLIGWLDEEKVRGYLWVKGEAEDSHVMANYEGSFVPLKVNENRSKITFSEDNDTIICKIEIKVKGSVEEFKFSDQSLKEDSVLSSLESQYETIIKKEIEETYDDFQNKYDIDGFDFSEHLRKWNYDLYKKYDFDYSKVSNKIIVMPVVDVEIENSGSIN